MPDERSPIHPELQTIAQRTPRFNISRRTHWLFNLLIAGMPPRRPPADVRIHNSFIPGPEQATKIRLRIYQPIAQTAPTPALLWLHGGGYLIGKPEIDERWSIDYARRGGLTVVSVDYRLAPKHPFPAALHDSYTALQWIVTHAQELGVDARRIALGGESAGGGLAAALAQLAHDRQEIQPVFQLLVYPMLDDRTALRTDLDDRHNVAWSQQSNRYGWESYLGSPCGSATVPAYAVPARRADLSGLSPAWIGVGDLDLFHDESAAYAQNLQECGVACELVVVPGAFHGFDVLAPNTTLVQDFRQSQINALLKHLPS